MPKDDERTTDEAEGGVDTLLDRAKQAAGKAVAGLATTEAGRKATAAATTAAAKAAAGEVTRRAKAAVDGVLDDAEGWVSKEASEAETRRAESGLPDTTAADPDWAEGLDEASGAAYRRGRTLADPVEEDAEAAEAAAARMAAAKDELARLKAALGRGGAIGDADDVLARASAARVAAAATDDDEAWPEGSLEAVAGVPTHTPTATMDADLDALAEAAARESRAGVQDPPVSDEERRATLVPETTLEQIDPALAALEAARAARVAAADETEMDLGLDPADDALGAAPDDDLPVDPAARALAMARGARQAAGTASPFETDDPTGVDLDTVEGVLEHARRIRAEAGASSADDIDAARREGRARAERLAQEALLQGMKQRFAPTQVELPPTPGVPTLPGAPATSDDPLGDADELLRRAAETRVAAGTTNAEIEAARAEGRARAEQIGRDAEAEGRAAAAARAEDPMAAAAALLDRSAALRAETSGSARTAVEITQDTIVAKAKARLARVSAETQLRRAKEERLLQEALEAHEGRTSPEALAKQVLDAADARPDPEDQAREVLDAAQAHREAQDARADQAAKDAAASAQRRAEIAAAASEGAAEDPVQRALRLAAEAREAAGGRNPALEASARAELAWRKSRQAHIDTPVPRHDLLGDEELDEVVDQPTADTAADDDTPDADVPKRDL